MGKVYIMRFSSDKHWILKKAIEVDGKIMVKDETWSLNDVEPTFITVNEGLIFKSKKQYPCYVIRNDIEKAVELKFGNPLDDEGATLEYVTPSIYKKIIESDTIRSWMTLRTKTHMADFMMYIVIGLVIGYLLGTIIPATQLIGFGGG